MVEMYDSVYVSSANLKRDQFISTTLNLSDSFSNGLKLNRLPVNNDPMP
jgi:hypothetical protein